MYMPSVTSLGVLKAMLKHPTLLDMPWKDPKRGGSDLIFISIFKQKKRITKR
jgi:hypothetical protein